MEPNSSEAKEDTQEKKPKTQKFSIAENRSKILKDVMKGEKTKQEEEVRKTVFEFFDEDYENSKLEEGCPEKVNMYDMILVMLQNIPDRKRPVGKVLAQWYLEDFVKWMEEKKIEEELKNEQLKDYIRQNAIRVCINNINLSSFLQRIFHITSEETVKKRDELIKEFMENRQFKEASDLVIKYGLVDNYTFEELVLPLILCDKAQCVDELLKESKIFPKNYITFLDYFAGESDEYVDQFFAPYVEKGLVTVNLNRYYGKCLTTFITKFFNEKVKQLKVTLDERTDAPKYDQYKKGRALKYFYMQRFENHTMTDDMYFDHVQNTLVNAGYRTSSYFFFLLWENESRENRIEILFWKKYFEHINRPLYSLFPAYMHQFLKSPDIDLLEDVDKLFEQRMGFPEDEVTEQLYVFEDVQKYPITIVKEEDELEELYKELDTVEDGEYVGYDSEFKPYHITQSSKSKMAIMQLFFNRKAFIIDCVELDKQQIQDESYKKLFEKIFGSQKFKVIAFDIKNDMEALFSIPAIQENFKHEDVKNGVCVKRFAETLNGMNTRILNLKELSSKLIVLVEDLLGLKLDKTEQAGSWQVRPLRKNQIIYAAMDAVSVYDLFMKMMELAKQFEPSVDVEKVLKESLFLGATTKKEGTKKDTKSLSSMQPSKIYELLHNHRDPSKPLQRISDLTIIADMMVLGAGKNLRLLGADVYLPKQTKEFLNHVESLENSGPDENRYVLTVPSKSYEVLKAAHPKLKFVLLPDVYTKTPMGLICDFFDRFNLDIRPDGTLINSNS